NSDTEVLINCYIEYGMDFLEKIDGMFAFAIIDFSKNMLYLVRDRIGIKPLYYYHSGKALSYASEIKALIKSGICKPEIDPAGFKDYIYMQLYIADKTMFKNIKAIEPGTYISVDCSSGLMQQHIYWDVPDEELDITYDEAIECLKYEIENSVKRWSMADVPIASY
ncbi:MAG TPA: asparagine synthetase B, partial [Clostridiaceae bacterium]|nr:asparagine synthetase B [Clostridiaceae bacterium]